MQDLYFLIVLNIIFFMKFNFLQLLFYPFFNFIKELKKRREHNLIDVIKIYFLFQYIINYLFDLFIGYYN